MKYRYAFLSFLVAFVLQSTIMIHFSVFGVAPNLVLCLVALFSFLYEKPYGMVMGIVFGLLLDICFAPVIGVSALSFFLVALLLGSIRHLLYQENLLSVIVTGLLSTVVFQVCEYLCYFLLGMGYHPLFVLRQMLILLVWHMVLLAVMYLMIARRMEKYPNDRYV